MQRRDGHGGVLGQPAIGGEADMRVTGLALSIVQAKRVHPLAAAIAGPAADVHLDPDTRPGRERHTLADRHDVAAELVPRYVREAGRRELARQDLLVGAADHRGAHADQRLVAGGPRRWDGVDPERAGPLEDDGAHARRQAHVTLGRPGKRSVATSSSSGRRSMVGASSEWPNVNVPRNVQRSGTLRIRFAFSVIQCWTNTPP